MNFGEIITKKGTTISFYFQDIETQLEFEKHIKESVFLTEEEIQNDLAGTVETQHGGKFDTGFGTHTHLLMNHQFNIRFLDDAGYREWLRSPVWDFENEIEDEMEVHEMTTSFVVVIVSRYGIANPSPEYIYKYAHDSAARRVVYIASQNHDCRLCTSPFCSGRNSLFDEEALIDAISDYKASQS